MAKGKTICNVCGQPFTDLDEHRQLVISLLAQLMPLHTFLRTSAKENQIVEGEQTL